MHEFDRRRRMTATLVNLPTAGFSVEGARPPRDAARVKAGAELSINPFVALHASFEGELAGPQGFFGGRGGLKARW